MPAKLLLAQAMVDPATLSPHPGNPRGHNIPVLRESIRRFGQIRPLLVNRGTLTGRAEEILGGHGTREAFMLERPGEKMQVSYLDVDDETASRILLVDNRTSDLGSYDDRLLAEILVGLPDLDGTGYTEADLAKLADDLSDEPPAPPILDGPGGGATRIIVLEFPQGVAEWAQTQLTAQAADLGVVSNEDVVVRLLAAATGTAAPEEN